jgi:hypothetical protein
MVASWLAVFLMGSMPNSVGLIHRPARQHAGISVFQQQEHRTSQCRLSLDGKVSFRSGM